jgi:hypothetical protein
MEKFIGMSFDDFMRAMLDFCPEAQIGEDNDGQLVIYTNLRISTGMGTVAIGDIEPFPDLEDEFGIGPEVWLGDSEAGPF